MSPRLFTGIVAGLLVLVAGLAIAAMEDGSTEQGVDYAVPEHGSPEPHLDLATANAALAEAAPGVGVRISAEELSSPDYPPERGRPGAYPPAPSLAVGVTPEWHKFAAMVDRVCAVSYNYMLALQRRALELAHARGWSRPRTAAEMWRLTADEDARILQATEVLGQPPRERALFARWRANVALRTDLFRQAGRAAGAGDVRRTERIDYRIGRLKIAADKLGQRFGLRICTSN